MKFAVLNNVLLPADETKISPDDRGFRFGDGVFETIRITRGVAYLWEDHLERLVEGLSALHIVFDTLQLAALAKELIQKNQVTEGILRISVSRGEGSRGYMPKADITATSYMSAVSVAMEGVSARQMLVSRYRKTSPASLPTHLKLANGLNSILALLEARNEGCDDALMLDENGNVAESANANIFWRKNGVVYTPRLSTGCLAGVMRKRFLTLTSGIIEVAEPLQMLVGADAAVLTNSAAYAIPVSGVLGHMTAFDSTAMADEWQEIIRKDIVRYIAQKHESACY